MFVRTLNSIASSGATNFQKLPVAALMDAVKRAKGRMQRFPRLLSLCATEANAYAMCVLSAHESGGPRGTGVTKGVCEAEFQSLKRCVTEVAKKAGTGL